MPNDKIKQIEIGSTTYDIEPAEVEELQTQEVNIIDNLVSSSSTDVLSANQGKVLNEKIAAIQLRGRYLSLWDATLGQPHDLPGGGSTTTEVYTYKSGDYFIVKVAGSKVPSGTSIPVGTTIATFPSADGDASQINDTIYFNGTSWAILHTPGGTGDVTGPASSVDNNLVSFSGTTGKAIKDSGISANDIVTTSKSAASGGKTKSLVTTGEKYTWNNKADDSNVVHKGSSTSSVQETIYGFKTFINGIHTGDAGLDIGATMISYNEGMRYLSLNTNSNTLRLQSMSGNIIIDANASDISLNGSNVNINTSSDIKLASSHNTVIHANDDGGDYKAYYYKTAVPETLEAIHELATIGDITAPQITPAGITQLVENKSYQITLTEDDAAILENTQNTLIKIVIPSPYSTLLGVSNAWIKRDSIIDSATPSVYVFSCTDVAINTADATMTKFGAFSITHPAGTTIAYLSIGKITFSSISHATNLDNGTGATALIQKQFDTFTTSNSQAIAAGYTGDVNVEATGAASVLLGGISKAEGDSSLVCGKNNIVTGWAAACLGQNCYASGSASFATGDRATASGTASNALGQGVVAAGGTQTVVGRWNDYETGEPNDYAFIVGNGSSTSRSNAMTVDWNGYVVVSGGLKINGNKDVLTLDTLPIWNGDVE